MPLASVLILLSFYFLVHDYSILDFFLWGWIPLSRLCFSGTKKIITSTKKIGPSFFSNIYLFSYFVILFEPFVLLSWPLSMFPFTKPYQILLLLFLLGPLHAIPSIIPLNGKCRDKCGSVPIKFPFGSDSGCGHPDFARYIKCIYGMLQFSTGTGIYTVSSIDYSSNTIVITDPLMSTCSSMQNSGSFTLERKSPFTVLPDNIFVLLGCSTTSPVFDRNTDFCDTGSGLNVCRGLYSCRSVEGIGLEPNGAISTCCVYDPPTALGSGYGLDLPKLQCSSYSAVNGFGGDEGDPMKWQYGISLQYNNSYYSNACKNCEDSGGFCGFAGLDESFACICQNGMNTTINCYGRGYAWSGTWSHKIQTKMCIGGFLLLWTMLFL